MCHQGHLCPGPECHLQAHLRPGPGSHLGAHLRSGSDDDSTEHHRSGSDGDSTGGHLPVNDGYLHHYSKSYLKGYSEAHLRQESCVSECCLGRDWVRTTLWLRQRFRFGFQGLQYGGAQSQTLVQVLLGQHRCREWVPTLPRRREVEDCCGSAVDALWPHVQAHLRIQTSHGPDSCFQDHGSCAWPHSASN